MLCHTFYFILFLNFIRTETRHLEAGRTFDGARKVILTIELNFDLSYTLCLNLLWNKIK